MFDIRLSVKVKLAIPLLEYVHCLERPFPKWPMLCQAGL